MTKLKELLSDTLVYGISNVLSRFINYLLVPLYTKVFETAQYGVVSLIYVAIAFFNVLFTFGMESAYMRYAKDREQARDVFKTVQLSLLGFASLLALLLWLLAPLIRPLMSLDAGTQSIYLLMIGIIWFDTLSIVPFAELRLERKSFQYAGIRLGNILINLGLNIYLILYRGWGIEAIFIANIAASGLTTLFIWGLTADMLQGRWRQPLLQQAIRFGAPFVPAGLGYAANEMLDRFFLNNYMSHATVVSLYGPGITTEDVVGIYSACYKLAVFMLLLIQMFRMAWQPFFLRNAGEEDAPALYAEVFLYFNIAAGAIFLGVALFAQQIVRIHIPFLDAYLIDPAYWSGLSVVPVLLGAYWFHGWYMNFSAGIFIEEKTKILPQITLLGVIITVAGNLILLPFFGMMGAAVTTLGSYAVMAVVLLWQARKVYHVPYPLPKVLLVMGWILVCLLLQSTLNSWTGSPWLANGLLFAAGMVGLSAIVYRAQTEKAQKF